MRILERLGGETAREYAFRALYDNIILLELEPSSLVSEQDLADRLHLSRTPVREALHELEKLRLVEIYPQKGCRISPIDFALVDEVNFLRITLEKAVVEEICAQSATLAFNGLRENVHLQDFYLQYPSGDKLLELDNAFHKALFALCNKQQIYVWLKNITAHFDRLRSLSVKNVAELKIVGDHKAILNALEAGDKDEACALMQKHLSRHLVEKQVFLEMYPAYFQTDMVSE